jgi:hypothetical protein
MASAAMRARDGRAESVTAATRKEVRMLAGSEARSSPNSGLTRTGQLFVEPSSLRRGDGRADSP